VDLSGHCLCGAVQFECHCEPIASYLCHCTDCQHSTGGAYAACVLVPKNELRVTRGRTAKFELAADSGNTVVREFCGECGSSLFSNSPSRPDWQVIRMGVLDHPHQTRPVLHIWTDSALAWALPDDAAPRLPKGPPRAA
jgi:hypothetical protein